ncbi:MAG: transposase, partial [Gemmatimonadetes bacterium]|nr:transposase [Gemmatimonadota bacterium]
MGAGKKKALKVGFDNRVRLVFRNAEISSDGGLLAIRDFDESFLLTQLACKELSETRTGRNIRHQMHSLIRQSVYSRLAGYEDVNDAERMAQDPVMRMICGLKDFDYNAAGSTTMARFETEILTQDENLEELESINLLWPIFARHKRQTEAILDIDSSESPVWGEQEGSQYNWYFQSRCFHPLFTFNQYGDCLAATLRPGNVHSADGWKQHLAPVVEIHETHRL